MMTRVYQNFKFHDPQGWGADVRLWPYKSLQWICIFFYSVNIQHIDCFCAKGLWCCFPIPSLSFIYSMMGLSIYKHEPCWQEVSVKFLILRWPLKPVGLSKKNQRFINQAHIIEGGMGCVSVCNKIPFIARKESLEKLNIVELFFYYCNFFL